MTEAITDALYGRPVLTLAVLLILVVAGLAGVTVTAVAHDKPALQPEYEPKHGALSPFPTPEGEAEVDELFPYWPEAEQLMGVLP